MVKEPPHESMADHIHLGARMALSAIPGFGGPALELFNRLIAPPIQRRRDAWLTDLAGRFKELEEKERLCLQDLVKSEEFISTLMQASMAAVRNHQREKLEALRNAVLNTALGETPEDSKRELFLTFVDSFTVWHLRILQEFLRHDHEVKTSVNDITELAQNLIPEIRGQPALADVVVDDLCRKGLLFWNRQLGATYIRPGTTQVTKLGLDFLRFVSQPLQGEAAAVKR
jgi:hypothetical protein